MLKAMTLLELVIVMAIVAVLMGMGALFLVNYQTSVQLQSAYTYTVSSVKTLQNKANNSASVTTSGGVRISPDMFALRINQNKISPYYCVISGGGGTLIDCDIYPSSAIVQFEDNYNVNATSDCEGFGFSRLVVDMSSLIPSAFTSNGTFNSLGTCTITLTHKVSGDSRTITIDLTQNRMNL